LRSGFPDLDYFLRSSDYEGSVFLFELLDHGKDASAYVALPKTSLRT
jgi:hypothetical protein